MFISNIFAEFRYDTKNPKKALKLKHFPPSFPNPKQETSSGVTQTGDQKEVTPSLRDILPSMFGF